MILDQRFYNALQDLPNFLGQHVLISVLSLAIGIAVSLPLAIWASRSKVVRYPVLTLASIVQTIPSLALLALFYPLLLLLSYVTGRFFGFEFSALGFLPTIIALTFYSMLPILRNTTTGIENVDASVIEAARGVGMTPMQVLLKVELPLAAPVIIAGIRTATVWVVGIATLSTPVGQTSLGNYIFTGLQTQNWVYVIFGCFFSALLALILDQLIGLGESAARNRSKSKAVSAVLGLLLVIAGGLAPAFYRPQQDFTVGSKTFSEQYILASLIENQLEKNGFTVGRRDGLGSTVIFQALANGEVDVYVDYSGTIWANYMNREETASPEVVVEEVTEWVKEEHGILSLGSLGFENAYGLAMRRKQARSLGIETIGDLADYSGDLVIGGDYEFFGRPEWEQVRKAYGLNFKERKQYQSTFMYKAVRSGAVDVISAFTSDGRIEAFDLVVLEDPKNSIPPYDAILLLSPEASENSKVIEALKSIIGSIDIEAMRKANFMVSRDENKKTPEQAAEWLRGEILGENN